MTETLKNEFLKLKTEIGVLVDQVDTSKNSHLQNYLYFVYFPLFSYVESLIILSENGKQHSAKVLLRTLFEIHINVIFFQIGDSERKLALSAKAGFDGKLRGIKELKSLIKKYPNFESQDTADLFSNAWLDSAEQWAEMQRKGILAGNNLKDSDQDLDLKSKTVKCDEAAIKNAEPGYFERMYSVIYRQLSPPSHLNIEGLQTFVTQDDSGKYLFNDGDGGEFLVGEAINICVAFTKDLYNFGVLRGDMPTVLGQLESRIKDK